MKSKNYIIFEFIEVPVAGLKQFSTLKKTFLIDPIKKARQNEQSTKNNLKQSASKQSRVKYVRRFVRYRRQR